MKRAPIKKDLTAEYVRQLFDYDPESGFLIHKERHGVKAAARAGYVNSGYRSVKIHQVSYLEHRIIWLWVAGEWPENDVDHKDLNKTNNKWLNLRPATRMQNVANGPARTRKYGTLKGAFFHKRWGYWRSAIRVDGKLLSLGNFKTELEAAKAYEAASIKHFGEYARVLDAA
jgi:hypothetical protein